MLKNTKIIIAVASVLITGIGAGTGAYIANRNNPEASASSEVTSMESKIESVDISPIDAAVSAGIEQIESATASAIQQIESKVAERVSIAPVQSKMSAPLEPVEIPLNVETQRGGGTLTFKGVDFDANKNMVRFYFVTEKEKIILADVIKTTLTGKSETVYPYGGGGQLMTQKYDCNQDMVFENITDFSDLSTVTLTYAFEGYDPVTVTFDIPGL